jgi:peptidoglycan/LPS O-acetylase OafA/YrhL
MQPSSSSDLPNLDFLRAVAVLLVLADHLTRHFQLYQFGSLGLFGVLLFFVHTALVLTYSMQRSHLGGWALVKDFYIRRFFRIYPLSIMAVLIAVALKLQPGMSGLAYGIRPGAGEITSNLLLIQNLTGSASVIGPLWSLPFEVQMYVVLPFLFLWKRRSVVTLLALWLIFGALGHFPEAYPGLAWLSLLIYVPNFLPGVLAATLPEKRTSSGHLCPAYRFPSYLFPAYLWPPFVLLLVATFFWKPTRLVGGLLCLLLGSAIPRFQQISFRPLTWVSHRIATYSYGIYLGHSFFIWYALTKHDSWILFWLMWTIIPAVVYHMFEHPMVQMGRRVARGVAQPKRVSSRVEESFGQPLPQPEIPPEASA